MMLRMYSSSVCRISDYDFKENKVMFVGYSCYLLVPVV